MTTEIKDMAGLIAQVRQELTDAVTAMAGAKGTDIAEAIKGRSEMLETLAMAFMGEVGCAAVDAILYERYDPETRTWSWWFEQRGNTDSIIESQRLKMQELIDKLDAATGQQHVYLNQINALGGSFAGELQRVSLSSAGPIMDADTADLVSGEIAKGVRDDLAGESSAASRSDQPGAEPAAAGKPTIEE